MAIINFDKVNLVYPVRNEPGLTFKEFLLRKFRNRQFKRLREVHSLRDIDLQIKDGDRVGIIGHNGAGKSTLLRTIAGVYPLASGNCQVLGSVCALFDLLFGFELEASGYENIFYRGYLQGETPRTLASKIDEIIDFCALGDFLALPLKCYSSGMLMRLGFSLATTSPSEILLMDEIFATGDLAFQQKAERRMRDFIQQAKIVVMVGHDLHFLEQFCTRVLWMNKGQIYQDGPAAQIIAAYTQDATRQRQAA